MIDAGTVTYFSNQFIIGTLMFVRIAALLSTAPLFSHAAVQPMHKIGIAGLMAITLTTFFWKEQPIIDVHAWYLVGLVAKEFLVGAAIGFSANLVMMAARFAGGMLDFDIGFQTALLFDQNADSPTLIGELKGMASLMIFLGINGHHFLLESMVASFRAVPLDTFALTGSSIEIIIRLITTVTIVAVKIAAPVMIALLVTNIALALLARVAPQLNIFAVSMQFKVAVGLIVLFITVPLFVMTMKQVMVIFQNETFQVLMALNPKRAS